ncbi:hypothetical protein [Bradyrhizobium ganzhouense]|uniref:hypothetical protein n=1 Tax=Bradyrhizobium ganzhouense TaxID=1179767 RepID=UPI003CF98A38
MKSAVHTAVAMLASALLLVSWASPAAAKHSHHRQWHAHHRVATPVHVADAASAGAARLAWGAAPMQVVAQAPIHLGPMRYYGGPKSPMWRGQAAN